MLYLTFNDKKAFSHLQTKDRIHFCLVRMYVTRYRISWILFTLDLVLSYTDKLLVFRCVQFLLLMQTCFFFILLREIFQNFPFE